tara:strand:- start:565 stop:1770 length:1206 start_codon:yes stop_codon:yes gene_type:complete
VFKKKLKIGMFWEQYEYGGVDSHIKYLIENWENKDDNFIIYHNKNNEGANRLKKELNGQNIFFKEFNSIFNDKKNYLGFILIPIKFIISIFKYMDVIRNDNLDVMISQNGGYPAAYGVLASLATSFRLKIPVRILVVHHQALKPNFFMNFFRGLLDKLVSKTASSIICVSEATYESLKKCTLLLNNENIHSRVIYNCVPDFKELEDKKNIFEKVENEKLIGIIGRIEDYKGHNDLIFSYSQLPEEIKKNNKILIIGKGKEEQILKVKSLIKKLNLEDRILFKGYIDEKIEKILKSLDLVVMPTRSFEGFGYTIAEAMSAGIPVLASKTGAVQELLSLKEGSLFQPGNISELTENLIDFNINNESWKKKTSLAKIKINKRFNAKKIAKEFRDHLQLKYLEKH